MNYKSSLSKSKGMGSTKSGTERFVWMRILAIMLIPLLIWFVVFVVNITRYSVADIHALIVSPISLIGVISVAGVALVHSVLGMRTIIEDYIHNTAMYITCIVCVYFVAIISLVAMVIASVHMHNLIRIAALLNL